MPTDVTVNGKQYILERPVASGSVGVVWKANTEFGQPRAIKFSIYGTARGDSYLREVRKAAALERYNSIARFVDAGLLDIPQENDDPLRVVALVEEWVDGLTLQEFMGRTPHLVTCSFLLAYVKGIARSLKALDSEGFRHADLHDRNVMISPPAKGELDAEYRIKVIDTGSLQPTSAVSSGTAGDYWYVVQHITALWNIIHRRRDIVVRDRRFLASLVPLLRSMLDEDATVALRDPARLVAQVSLANTRANDPLRDDTAHLASPFEFISAEHIADDRLLLSLFAASCPWLDKVARADPCLITGPRGCGKSTILRWLSLKPHLTVDSAQSREHLDQVRIAGFYISCSTDLQNRLGWITTEAMADRLRDAIIHYFNLLTIREVIHTLAIISHRADRDSYWQFGQEQESQLYTFLFQSLGVPAPPPFQGLSRLDQVREMMESAMVATHSAMRQGLTPPNTTPETLLGDVTSLLVRLIPYFEKRRIAFLLDDYSVHRLPFSVQKVLNRIIWERRSSHIFKLSCEKYGAELTDLLHSTADVRREMVEVDCGQEYLSLDDSEQRHKALAFATDLLNNRLRSAGYVADAHALIGHSSWPEGSLGKALATERKGRRADYYHGLECISQLCSGDVSSLLYVYSRIFDEGNVTATTTTTVAAHVQHRSVRTVSRVLLQAIKQYHPLGQEMFAVVLAFGKLVRNVLVHGRRQKSKAPTQCPRIEVDQKVGAASDVLPPALRHLSEELIRRAIFIEMEPGLSRHGNVTTLRWQIRRIYLPAFGAALAKNDAIKRDPDWFKYFLSDPTGACQMAETAWRIGGGKKKRKSSKGDSNLLFEVDE